MTKPAIGAGVLALAMIVILVLYPGRNQIARGRQPRQPNPGGGQAMGKP